MFQVFLISFFLVIRSRTLSWFPFGKYFKVHCVHSILALITIFLPGGNGVNRGRPFSRVTNCHTCHL